MPLDPPVPPTKPAAAFQRRDFFDNKSLSVLAFVYYGCPCVVIKSSRASFVSLASPFILG